MAAGRYLSRGWRTGRRTRSTIRGFRHSLADCQSKWVTKSSARSASLSACAQQRLEGVAHALAKVDLRPGYRRREVTDLFRRNRHAAPFCISYYLRNRPGAGGTTSQGAKPVGCHVKIASSGTKRKSNPTGGAEGSEISGFAESRRKNKNSVVQKEERS